MTKALLSGAAAAALLATSAAAARPESGRPDFGRPDPGRPEAAAWVLAPAVDSCRTELELTGIASGVVAPVTLVADSAGVSLVFAKADAPSQAFLPIRVDHKPFANLVLRQADGKTATMPLSAETLAALKKGGTLQIGWLADEPVQMSLAGSEQGLADLRACGAQVAQRFREQQDAQREADARAAAEARAKALADEQLAAVKAQKEAAEAEARRSAAEAERLHAQAEADRQRAQAEAEAARERADEQAQAEAYPYARARDDRGYRDPRDGYYAQDPYAYGTPYRGW